MSKEIQLTQSKVAVVDDADFEWLNQWKWFACKHRGTWYAERSKRQSGKMTKIRMHREILKPPLGMETDHKDGHRLNNQRHNLRIATHAQNLHNRKKQKGTTSRFKGVYWNRQRAKWQAQIMVEGKLFYLGCFLSEIEAAKAYDRAARKYFGAYACTNFMRPRNRAWNFSPRMKKIFCS